MYELPTSVKIGGQSWSIRNQGDFRVVLDCFSALEDPELEGGERVMAALIIFFDGMEDIEDLMQLGNIDDAIKAMYEWFDAGRPQSIVPNKTKLIDWEIDSAMICASINKVAGFEIRSQEYIHWWTFMGYFMGIGEGTLATVVSIRDKIIKCKKLEKWEQEFKRDNPQYFNWNANPIEDAEADAWFNEVWNKE